MGGDIGSGRMEVCPQSWRGSGLVETRKNKGKHQCNRKFWRQQNSADLLHVNGIERRILLRQVCLPLRDSIQ